MDPSPSEFLARPFVCGRLGGPALAHADRLERLHQAVPGLVTIHERPDVHLLAAGPLAPYRDGPGIVAWSFGDRTPDASDDWRGTAVRVEAPGLADLADRVVLHAGALGFIDLFTRELDGATWFSSRIEPLLALDSAPLDVDWAAWASVYAFNCPVGDATPFRPVRRLNGACTVVLERPAQRIRTERWSPPWHGLTDVDPDAGDPAAVMELLREVTRRLQGGPHAIALSGGFDSRMVALAAHGAGLQMTAWSTSKDDSLDDIPITRELAAILGLQLRFVDPTAVPYGSAGREVRRRSQGMVSMNTWMGPLGAALRNNGEPVLTDLVGGVILGGANTTAEMVDMAPGTERRLALMSRLQRRPIVGETLDERAAPWVMDTARESWLAAVRHLDGDANELVLAMLDTRDARGIAAMPYWLFSPAVRVELPLSRPEMMHAALSVGARRKVGKAFSREVIQAADPVVGELRTSHDPRPDSSRTIQHKTSPEGLAWLRSDIEHARELPGLVPEGLLRYLELGRWSGPRRRDRLLRQTAPPNARAFQSRHMADVARLALPVATLGSWLDTNRHRLASLEPPWLERGRRVRRG